MGIAAKTDSAVNGLADLKGKIVGVLSGSTGEKWAKENQAADGFSEIKGYNTQQELLLDLSAGRVDAVVSDIPGMEYAFTKMQGLAVKERIKTGEQYGLMMTKDHPLLGKLNDALTEMKKDGTLQRSTRSGSAPTRRPAPRRSPKRRCRRPERRPQRRHRAGFAGTIWIAGIRDCLPEPAMSRGRPIVHSRHALARTPVDSGMPMSLLDTFFNARGPGVRPCRRCCAASSTRCCSALMSIGIGVPVGLLISLVRLYAPKPLRLLAIGYIDIFRAMPILVVLILIYYALPFLGIRLSSWTSAVMAFSIVMAAYSAEVFRSGIESIPQRPVRGGAARSACRSC